MGEMLTKKDACSAATGIKPSDVRTSQHTISMNALGVETCCMVLKNAVLQRR